MGGLQCCRGLAVTDFVIFLMKVPLLDLKAVPENFRNALHTGGSARMSDFQRLILRE